KRPTFLITRQNPSNLERLLRVPLIRQRFASSWGRAEAAEARPSERKLWNQENFARVRVFHLAAGRETVYVHITAIRIIWTKHVARFSRHSLGSGVLGGAIGSAFRRRI